MAGANGFESGKPSAHINVTPLVDVMLVLLVIFMITAPMLQQGVEVNLPKTEAGTLSGKGEQIVVSIDKKGNIYLGAGNKVTLSQLGSKLKAIFKRKNAENKKVYIKADKNINYGIVMEVIGALYKANITAVGLVTEYPNK